MEVNHDNVLGMVGIFRKEQHRLEEHDFRTQQSPIPLVGVMVLDSYCDMQSDRITGNMICPCCP